MSTSRSSKVLLARKVLEATGKAGSSGFETLDPISVLLTAARTHTLTAEGQVLLASMRISIYTNCSPFSIATEMRKRFFMSAFCSLLATENRGREGAQGAPGPQGPGGDKGPKGETGIEGPQGPEGDQIIRILCACLVNQSGCGCVRVCMHEKGEEYTFLFAPLRFCACSCIHTSKLDYSIMRCDSPCAML
jgi:hypothetical protein